MPRPQPRDDPADLAARRPAPACVVRVTDTGGNVVERGPVPGRPSSRRPTAARSTATSATDTGTLDVGWTIGGKRGRTLSYGAPRRRPRPPAQRAGAPDRGRARHAAHARPAPRRAARPARRRSSPGRRQLPHHGQRDRVAAAPVRLAEPRQRRPLRRQRLPDAAGPRVARLSVSTRRPRVGRRFTLSGRLRGVSRGGVTVILQGRARGSRRYETFADTTSRRAAAASASATASATPRSRGRSFVFRARIRPSRALPVRDRLLARP